MIKTKREVETARAQAFYVLGYVGTAKYQLLQYGKALGGTSNQINACILEGFQNHGVTANNVEDGWMEFLLMHGEQSDHINNMQYEYWLSITHGSDIA